MFTASFLSKQASAPHLARRQTNGWFRMKHSWVIVLAVLQSACSMLIRFDDGIDDEDPSLGGSTSNPLTPDAGTAGVGGADGVAGSDAVGGSAGVGGGGSDAGAIAPAPPAYALAFIEDPEESDATLRLVSSELALTLGSGQASSWRLTLRPADQAGSVIDFAWSPDGDRIAVRYVAVRGVTRIAFFAAPEWNELTREEAVSDATQPGLDAKANYRWSPSGDALALELEGGPQPLVSAYVIEGATAFGVEPVVVPGPIEAMEWRSATSLYVIQPQEGDPELLDLRLNQREFDAPVSLFSVLFYPIELRRVSGGLVAADDEPSSLNFWPGSADQGTESSFTESSFISGGASFVAEIVGTSAQISPIGSVFTVVDTVPDCPTVLTWVDGPERRSLAGAKLACLSVQNGAASISVHSYDDSGVRTAVALENEALRSDFVSTEDWELHARSFSPRGEFLSLATAAHDVLVDLRGSSPSFQVGDAAGPGNTLSGFSPSGEVLLRQRGRGVDVVLLSSGESLAPRASLPDAFADAPACVAKQHSGLWCGSASAAREASARWSFGSDVAAFLAEQGGLSVLRPSRDVLGLEREPVSTCGAGCVTQYEFGR